MYALKDELKMYFVAVEGKKVNVTRQKNVASTFDTKEQAEKVRRLLKFGKWEIVEL